MLSYFQVFETSTSKKKNHLIDYDKTVALNEECFIVGQNCKKERKKNVYSTEYSQAVTHPSTNSAQKCIWKSIWSVQWTFQVYKVAASNQHDVVLLSFGSYLQIASDKQYYSQ